jgi:AcrR family transcriptional regulator
VAANPPAPGTRPGGRTARVRESVQHATLQIIADEGYESLTQARVAELAGVAVSTVYRRWPTRADLVRDAVIALNDWAVPVLPDAPLRAQLRAIAGAVSTTLEDPMVMGIVRALAAIGTAEIDGVRADLASARAAAYAPLVRHAITRGELAAGTDPWELIEQITSPIWMRRLVTGIAIDDAWLDRLVDRVARANA